MNKKRLSCNIDYDTYYLLKAYCDFHDIKISGLVNALLLYGICRLFNEVEQNGCK